MEIEEVATPAAAGDVQRRGLTLRGDQSRGDVRGGGKMERRGSKVHTIPGSYRTQLSDLRRKNVFVAFLVV